MKDDCVSVLARLQIQSLCEPTYSSGLSSDTQDRRVWEESQLEEASLDWWPRLWKPRLVSEPPAEKVD